MDELGPEEKCEMAIRLLREIAKYDPAIAVRLRELGLESDEEQPKDDPS